MGRNRISTIQSPRTTRSVGVLLLGISLIVGIQARPASAQVSAASASASTAASSASGSTGASGTQTTSIFQLIMKIPACCAKLKAAFCASCCGQMFSGMLQPITTMSGGCIQCCPPVPKGATAKPGAEGACAMLTVDLTEARQRMQAVKCLASADCNWWPEAEEALIGYLRADKNECVRLYAAQTLGRGCCCTANVMKALELSATGSDADGNPRETSRRVRAAARAALARCNCQYIDYNQLDKVMQQDGQSVAPVEPAPQTTSYETPTDYYDQFAGRLDSQMAAEIRMNLARAPKPVAPPPSSQRPAVVADSAGRGLWSIIKQAATNEAPAPSTPAPQPAEAMTGRIVKRPLPPAAPEQIPQAVSLDQRGIYMPQAGDGRSGPELPPLSEEEERMVAEMTSEQIALESGQSVAAPQSQLGGNAEPATPAAPGKKRFWQNRFHFTGFRGLRGNGN